MQPNITREFLTSVNPGSSAGTASVVAAPLEIPVRSACSCRSPAAMLVRSMACPVSHAAPARDRITLSSLVLARISPWVPRAAGPVGKRARGEEKRSVHNHSPPAGLVCRGPAALLGWPGGSGLAQGGNRYSSFFFRYLASPRNFPWRPGAGSRRGDTSRERRIQAPSVFPRLVEP